jgi:hypothetical protein
MRVHPPAARGRLTGAGGAARPSSPETHGHTGDGRMTGEQHEHAAHKFLELSERAADYDEATYLVTAAAAHASLAVLAELQRARGGGAAGAGGQTGEGE